MPTKPTQVSITSLQRYSITSFPLQVLFSSISYWLPMRIKRCTCGFGYEDGGSRKRGNFNKAARIYPARLRLSVRQTESVGRRTHVPDFFTIKPTRCTNFTNLFWHETLHVSESSSVHHQEFTVNKLLLMDRGTLRNM